MKSLCAAIVLAAVAATGAAAQEGERVQITLERTPCFGRCPDYVVTLDGDGTVHYTGRQFVRVRGAQTWKIDAAAVYTLAREMERAGFFGWNDAYTGMITDLPTTFTTLTIGSRTKKIKDYYGAPPALKEIEARIEKESGVRGYVAIDGKSVREMRAKGWRPTGDDAVAWMNDALYAGDADTVKALLAAGMDARVRDDEGVTLVMKAAVSGDPDTVRSVLAAGGDPTARDRSGRNAADRARDGRKDLPGPATPCLVRATGHACDFATILRLLIDE
jgi:hypothetical protein